MIAQRTLDSQGTQETQEKDNWLSKDEWNKLDELLGKHGFGGYYDLVECLKQVIDHLDMNLDLSLKPNWKQKAKDLPTVVNLLLVVSEVPKK